MGLVPSFDASGELRLGYAYRLCEQIATINNHETSSHVVCCTAYQEEHNFGDIVWFSHSS